MRSHRSWIVALTACASACGGSERTDGASLALSDGSFEQGGQGWALSGVTVVEVGPGAFHGTHALLFDPGDDPGLRYGSARVRLATEVGRQYRVTFAHQGGFERGNPALALTIDGEHPHDAVTEVWITGAMEARELPERSAWSETDGRFFAEHALTELQIGPLSRWEPGIRWGRVWIDDVRVEVLPRRRALGTEVEVRATLPSDAVAGQEVELTVSLTGRLQSPPTPFDTRPAHCTVEFALESSDPLAVLPERIRFQDEASRIERLSFWTPGVQRVTLRTGEGFEARSNPVLVHERAPEKRSYWGDIHIHTELGHADWPGGDGALNYTFARDFADLDFAALSEHFHASEVGGWMEQLVPATLAFDQPGRFATLLGIEMFSYQGHHNFYLRSGDPLDMFDGRNPFRSRDAAGADLRSRGVPFLAIPHHFMLLDPVDWRSTDREALRLAEIYSTHGSSEEAGAWWRHPAQTGNDYGETGGARGHDFRTGLARGHRLGVIACSDSHFAQPGLAGLTCVRATALTREALFDALWRRDCYATSGARTLLDFALEAAPPGDTPRVAVSAVSMGGELFLPPGASLQARVVVHASAPIEAVELVQEGTLVASARPDSPDFDGAFALGAFSGRPTYVYARVRQRDEHRVWASPIWIDPARVPDLALEEKDLSFDFASGTLAVTPRNYGDESARAVLRLYSSQGAPGLAEVSEDALRQPALLLRVEPASPGRARLKAVLYTPRNVGKIFSFSGELRFSDAAGYRIVADPRGMLTADGALTLRWKDELGKRFPASRAGQITDFELWVDTNPGTTVEVAPLVDGSPLAEVWVGSQVHRTPATVPIPIGELARTPPLDERTVALDPRLPPETVLFADLPRGATYVAVLDPEDRVTESDELDNAAALSVPEEPPRTSHWPDRGR